MVVLGGIGFLDCLTLLFIGLKLSDIISWSWWLVTLPFWGQFALVAVICVIYFISIIVRGTIEYFKDKKRYNDWP